MDIDSSQPHDARPPLELLLEDGPLLAFNKPAGLLTQGVPGAQSSLESQAKAYLKAKLGKPGNVYLGVPHRLDRPVSGIVVFAKNSKAAARLAEQFRERLVSKVYLAVVEHVPAATEGTMNDWLLKDAELANVRVVAKGVEGAKKAILDYEVIAVRNNRSLVRIELHTGRMHQIRVQFASRGCPIVGDFQYGSADPSAIAPKDNSDGSPITLHAWRLRLLHPVRYDAIELQAPLPQHWTEYGFVIPKGL